MTVHAMRDGKHNGQRARSGQATPVCQAHRSTGTLGDSNSLHEKCRIRVQDSVFWCTEDRIFSAPETAYTQLNNTHGRHGQTGPDTLAKVRLAGCTFWRGAGASQTLTNGELSRLRRGGSCGDGSRDGGSCDGGCWPHDQPLPVVQPRTRAEV